MDPVARLELPAFALLVAVLAYAWTALAPESPLQDPLHPTCFATIAAVLTAATLILLRLLPRRPLQLERLTLALFLAAMPLIYLWSAALHGDRGGMLLEAIGLPLFGTMALLGWRGRPALLAIGIAAHGIAWDAWHHGHSNYIEDWYALGCLLVDVALGLLVWAQLPAHAAALPQRTAPA